ncbi:hypothetical protein A8B73_14725 [Methylosinus sp. 3S-1]|nr:hypothetical protein A8B73_14725 [Methylosinus sp. 3S-1]
MAAFALAFEIFRLGAADALATSEPETAIAFDGLQPVAALRLAERRMAEEPAAAAAVAAALLARDPLAPGALTLLATATARGGDAARAARMFHVAGAHLPIDLAAHAALFDLALPARDAASALAELDILLRARPFLAPRMGAPVAALLALGPQAEQGFAELLARAPPWRGALLVEINGHLADSDALARLHDRLRASPAPPTLEETRVLLLRLLSDGAIDQAYLAWLNMLTPETLADLGLLYNGRFRRPPTNLPFDWELMPVRGAEARVTSAEGGGTLDVEFYDTRVSFAHVRHFLTLPAGDYAFSGVASAEDLRTERGLRWRLACFRGSWAELATTFLLAGAQPPRPFATRFVVPAEGCGAQTLVLELPARVATELQISGAAHYSRLAIERLGP